MPRGEAQIGYVELLRRRRDYRLLYAAQTLSLLGDWFNVIAVLLVLTQITGSSALSVSWVFILKLLPIFLMGPVAGVVVDRTSRKAILITTDLLRCATVLTILLVAVHPRAWIVYAATALQIALSAFFEPARTASIPNLVPREELAAANALGAVTWSAMFTLGAALGGVVTDRFGWEAAILVDAASYIASAFLISRVRLPHRRRAPRGQEALTLVEATGARDVIEGAVYIRSRREVAALILVKPIWGTAAAITLILTVLGEREYAYAGSAALGISLLYTARAVGTGLGPVLARRLTSGRPAAMWRILGWAYLWGAVWYLGFAASRRAWLAALCVAIAHLGGSTLWVFSTVLLQQAVPDEYRGRVFAAELGLFTLVASISLFGYGWLLDGTPATPREVLVLMSLGLLLPAYAWIRANRSRVGG